MFWTILLKGKPKIGIEDFCRQFYDSHIFHAIVAGDDTNSGLCEVSFNTVVEADPSFAVVDRDLFRQEITALHMELFGLAWSHRFRRHKYLLCEIAFTKSYLEENGHYDIWETMPTYNTAIARSEIISQNTWERMRVTRAIFVNKFRFELFGKWVETGVDPECANRVLNRMFIDAACIKKRTLKHLTAWCVKRLGCDTNLNPEALFALSVVLWGQYNGAKEAIKSMKIRPPNFVTQSRFEGLPHHFNDCLS